MLQYQCLVMYFWKKCLSWKTQIKVYFDFQLFFVDWFWQTIPQMNGVGQISTTTKNMWVILLFWHHLWYVTDDVTNVRGLKMNMFWNPLIKTAKLRYWLSKSVGNVLFNDCFLSLWRQNPFIGRRTKSKYIRPMNDTITIYRGFFYFAHRLIRGLHSLLSLGTPAAG